MSETVRYSGKLKLIPKLENESLEDQCKRILREHNYFELNEYYDSWQGMFYDKFYETYVISSDSIYEIIEKHSKPIDYDIFEAYPNKDGTISFNVMYYNGGCSLDEAIEYALESVENNQEEEEYCEWFKYDYRTIVPKKHDVDNPYWRIPENMDKLKYCPYCGKIIKVTN